MELGSPTNALGGYMGPTLFWGWRGVPGSCISDRPAVQSSREPQPHLRLTFPTELTPQLSATEPISYVRERALCPLSAYSVFWLTAPLAYWHAGLPCLCLLHNLSLNHASALDPALHITGPRHDQHHLRYAARAGLCAEAGMHARTAQ